MFELCPNCDEQAKQWEQLRELRAAVEDVERRLRLWPDVTGDPESAALWGLHADTKVTTIYADALRKALDA